MAGAWFTAPKELVCFVVQECYWNALSYAQDSVTIAFAVRQKVLEGDGRDIEVEVSVTNDIDKTLQPSKGRRKGKGVRACEIAADSVNGRFVADEVGSPTDGEEPSWVANLKVSGYPVPRAIGGCAQ